MTQKSMSFIYVVMVTVEEFLKKNKTKTTTKYGAQGKTSIVNQCLMANIWRLK